MRRIPRFGGRIWPTIELDKIDRKILAILQANGRLSNQDVADQVSLSPVPCLRRIKRLEESGRDPQYVALLDPAQIGLGLLAYVNVRLEKHGEGANAAGQANSRRRTPTFRGRCEDWPEVVACYAMTGDMDYLLRVQVEDMEHFSRFMKDQLAAPSVGDRREDRALRWSGSRKRRRCRVR